MSGFDEIKRAQEDARKRELEYKRACVPCITSFCEAFATWMGVSCGHDRRTGNELHRSDAPVSFIDPPYFAEADATVWTVLRVQSHEITIKVRRLDGTLIIMVLGREFTEASREDAFQHIKDAIVKKIKSGSVPS